MSDRVAVSEPIAHRAGIAGDGGAPFEPYRPELVAHCYRMLGPAFE